MNTEQLLHRVRTIMPDLDIQQVERDEEGLINDVWIVNRAWVLRFAKTEEAQRILQNELGILDRIRPQIGVQVPNPAARGADFIAYPYLHGQALTLKEVRQLGEVDRRKIATQLGEFLNRLHATDLSADLGELPATRAPVRRENWLDLRVRAQKRLYPLLLKYQLETMEDLFAMLDDPDFFGYPPALIHGDLAPSHLLWDPQSSRLSGVLDFGVAGVGDPASDIGMLIQLYGETFVRGMASTYPGLNACLPRARLYARLLELQWSLLGLETGENFWFTAHLGGARDILG